MVVVRRGRLCGRGWAILDVRPAVRSEENRGTEAKREEAPGSRASLGIEMERPYGSKYGNVAFQTALLSIARPGRQRKPTAIKCTINSPTPRHATTAMPLAFGKRPPAQSGNSRFLSFPRQKNPSARQLKPRGARQNPRVAPQNPLFFCHVFCAKKMGFALKKEEKNFRASARNTIHRAQKRIQMPPPPRGE